MAGLGTILNEIIDDADGELALKFTLTLGTGNVAASSAEEKEGRAGDAQSRAQAPRREGAVGGFLAVSEERSSRQP